MKIVFTIFAFLFSLTLFSQGVDCNSHRFDQEVFSNVTVTSNVVYGSNTDANGSTVSLTLDVYEPTGDTMQMRPLIIWAHGGSFLSGTKNDVDVVSLSQHFAKRGYVCVSINYRLGIPFPIDQNNAMKAVFRATQDMKAAIRFMRKDAATANQYKIDPAIIFGGGSSAGAFTALHAAYLDEYSELPAQLDTTVMGSIEGNSGTPGYSSGINAVIDLCGALGNKTWIHPGDVPFVAMHGTNDGTVPYGTALIYVLGAFPVMVVDGSYSIAGYADTIGVANDFYTYFGADHVPYVTSTAYMDTTVRFVSNFLYRYLGCNPVDPTPFPNTFSTGVNEFAFDKGVNVFPNPASEFIQIDLNDPINRVELIDMSGRTILLRVPDADHRISLQNISQGVYVMHITSKNFNAIRKIVIE